MTCRTCGKELWNDNNIIQQHMQKYHIKDRSKNKRLPAPEPPKKDEPKEDPHMTAAKNMPSGINFGNCAGDNCGIKLSNPHQTKKYKSCPHCEDNTYKKGSGMCKTCGKSITEEQEEDLDEGVELEEDSDE